MKYDVRYVLTWDREHSPWLFTSHCTKSLKIHHRSLWTFSFRPSLTKMPRLFFQGWTFERKSLRPEISQGCSEAPGHHLGRGKDDPACPWVSGCGWFFVGSVEAVKVISILFCVFSVLRHVGCDDNGILINLNFMFVFIIDVLLIVIIFLTRCWNRSNDTKQ